MEGERVNASTQIKMQEIQILFKDGSIGMPSDKGKLSYYLPSTNETMRTGEPELDLEYSAIMPMIDFIGYSQAELAEALELDPSTLSRWKKENKNIGKIRTKAMRDIDQIIAKGVRIFGNESNLKIWLDSPNHALGDQKPFDLLKSPYGIDLVDDALEAMSWGQAF